MPTFEHDGSTLGYNDTGGDGTPVLLVHGFPFDARMWDGQVEALGSRYRLIAADLKGFGSSEAPEDRSGYSIDAYADDLKALLDELGLAQVVLMGLSMGGYIALAFMRKYPDAVRGLVLADTRAEADPPEGVEKRSNQQKQVEAEGTSGLIDGLAGALLSATTKENKPDVVDSLKTIMKQPDVAFIGALEAMKTRGDSTPVLTGIKVPTLIIVGEHDAVTPPDAARKLHEHIGGSKLVVIPDAGHISNMESPDAFNGAVAEFLGTL